MSGRNLFDPNVQRSIRENLSRNCLSYWFPILQTSGARVPKTVIIKTDVELGHLLDGRVPESFDSFIKSIESAAISISKEGPWFLRTGMLSGKHSWLDTCYVPTLEGFPAHVANLVEESAMCDMIGRPFNVWVVREFIPMISEFTAFNGLPINKERRYFIKDGEVICHHPYWPKEAFEDNLPFDTNRFGKLVALNYELHSDTVWLTNEARRISRYFEGAWSLDFSQAKTGEWISIDMAVAEESYHWSGCPNNVDVTKAGESIKYRFGARVKSPKNPNRSHGADQLRAANRRIEMKKGHTRG